MKQPAEQRCALCEREGPTTFHHLIPRTCHRNKWFRKNFSRAEMRERGVQLCRRCHSFIHQQFSEKELGRRLNTLDQLRQNETVKGFTQWARKQR